MNDNHPLRSNPMYMAMPMARRLIAAENCVEGLVEEHDKWQVRAWMLGILVVVQFAVIVWLVFA